MNDLDRQQVAPNQTDLLPYLGNAKSKHGRGTPYDIHQFSKVMDVPKYH